MFNEKVDSQAGRDWNNFKNLGITDIAAEQVPNQTAAYGCNARFNIKNSYAVYRLRNNTQQQMTVKAYICAPKFQGNKTSNVVTRDNVALGTNTNYCGQDAGQTWSDTMADFTGNNLAAATAFNMGSEPTKQPVFNKLFSTECKTFIMESGQSEEFTVQGPTNQTLDYRKYFQNSIFRDIQKYSRSIFFVRTSDLISGGGADINKIGRFKTTSLGNIAVEIELNYKISMPDSVGAKVTGNAGVQEANLRKNVYFLKTYDAATPATLLRYDEVQPATAIG
jgi:hypothetical protein